MNLSNKVVLMLKQLLLIAALALSPFFASAQPQATTPPSDASLEQLLTLTHADQIYTSIQRQTRASLKPLFDKAVEQIVAAHPERREHVTQAFDKFMNMTMDSLETELSWTALKPATLEIYRSTFSQEEINAMIAFYSSAVGQSVIAKLPLATQKSSQMVQQRMAPVMQRVVYQAQQMASALAAEPEEKDEHKH